MIFLLAAILSSPASAVDAQKSLEQALKAKDVRAEAAARTAVARATFPLRWSALAHARLALGAHIKLKDEVGQAADLATIGAIYQQHGFSTAALPPLREALKIQRRLGRAAEAADTGETLAIALESSGSYEDAAAHLAAALEWRSKNQPGRLDLIRLQVRLGTLETNLGRYESAAEHLGAALETIGKVRARLSKEQWSRLQDAVVPPAIGLMQSIFQAPPEQSTPNPDRALLEAVGVVGRELHEGVFPEGKALAIEVRPTSAPPVRQTSNLLASAAAKKQWADMMAQRASVFATYEHPQMPPEMAKAMMMAHPEETVQWLADGAGLFNRRVQEMEGLHEPSQACLDEQARQLNDLLKKNGYPAKVTAAMILAESVEDKKDEKSEEREDAEFLDMIDSKMMATFAQMAEMRTALRREISKVVKRDPQTIEDFMEAPPCEAQLAGSLQRIHTILGNASEAEAMKERAWELSLEWSGHVEKVHAGAGLDTGADLTAIYRAAKQRGIGAPPSTSSGCQGNPLTDHNALWDADLQALEGQVEQAIAKYRTVANSEPSLRPAALTSLAALYEKRGDTKNALAAYRAAIDAVEAVQSHLRLDQLVASWSSTQAPLYARAVGLLRDLDQPDLAFQYAERARARAFLNQMGNRKLPPAAAPPELAAEIQEVRRTLIELESVERRPKTTDPIEALVASRTGDRNLEREQARKRYEELRGRLAQSNPAYVSLVQVDTASVRQLQREILPARTTLIEYFVLQDRTLAWVVDRDRMQCITLKMSRRELSDSVQHLRQLIASRERATQEVAGQLYTALVDPLRRLIRNPNIIVVPHDTLHLLPFHALWDSSRKRYLIEDYTVAVAPSASALRFILTKRSRAAGLVVLGNPDYSLPHAEQEAKSVAALYGGSALLGKEAREAKLRDELGRAGMLHIAAHARYDVGRPLFTSIELAPDAGDAARDERSDGHLHLHEIYDLDLRGTRLAVVSACDTALGPRDEGDDLAALTRAFLYAGVPTVVTTLWSIDDPASATLMELFYRRMHEGTAPAAALRDAQLEVLRRSGLSHPYYWAAFTLTGNPIN